MSCRCDGEFCAHRPEGARSVLLKCRYCGQDATLDQLLRSHVCQPICRPLVRWRKVLIVKIQLGHGLFARRWHVSPWGIMGPNFEKSRRSRALTVAVPAWRC